VSDLESAIDELYKLPLRDFTPARNALAKKVAGAEGRQVRQLAKPTLVPWTVNQVYWRARPLYERLLKSGAALRTAQMAALEGDRADTRRAADAFRGVLTDAVKRGVDLAGGEGSRPAADEVGQMLEALALASTHPNRPGRLTQLVKPAGFEALAGFRPDRQVRSDLKVRPAAPGAKVRAPSEHEPRAGLRVHPATGSARRQRAAERERARKLEAARKREAAEQRRRDAAITAAERSLQRAHRDEARARAAAEKALEKLQKAERDLESARRGGPKRAT
jgi:hypothetical protein